MKEYIIYESDVKLEGKTVIVTGSTAGIGKECVKDFLKRGARVIMACRNLEKGNRIKDELMKNDSSTGEAVVMKLDLSSLDSVRNFANEFIMSIFHI